MDDQVTSPQKDLAENESQSHDLSKGRVLSREGTLESPGLKFKRLIKLANQQHALVSNVNISMISRYGISSPLFQSTIGVYSRIPKHLLCADEKFRRRCLELIYLSASKAAQCKEAVNLSSAKVSGLVRDTCESARFAYECPLAGGVGSVVINPTGQWIVGSVMGSKRMLNILKNPLLQKVVPEGGNADSGRMNVNDEKRSICYDLTESTGALTLSSPKIEKEVPVTGSIENESDWGHRRLLSTCNGDCLSPDQFSFSALGIISQGMLQCTSKDGNPYFIFSTVEWKEVYVANLWEVQSKENKSLDHIYLFHEEKGGQKNHDKKHEIRNSDSHLIGKMKVSNSVSLCSNNSKILETKFVLYGGVVGMHTSSHNLRNSKGLSEKMAGVFRTNHLSKQKIIPKLSGTHNPSGEPCLDDKSKYQVALRVPNLLDDNLPPNLQLAAIVTKYHLPDDRKKEAGGWGLKFLNKVGGKKTNNSAEVSVPLESGQTDGDCSTTMDVLIPAGLHGGQRTRSRGPSSLIERWKCGGYCDCGGWDVGCPLTVLKSKSSKESILPPSDTQGECEPFDLNIQGSENAAPTFRMVNAHGGVYFVHFQPTLSDLQAFSIAVAIIHRQTPSLRSKCIDISTKIQR